MTPPTCGVAVVTGAGSGVGAAVSLALAGAGWSVLLAGRREQPLAAVARRGADLRGRLDSVPTDVTDESAVAALFVHAVDAHGRVDLLVNNAGRFGPSGTPDEVDPADWQATIAVNLTGAFLCAHAAFRVMRSQDPCGGRIINNGSISAQVPRPGSIAYTASKHAVTGLTRSLALDGRAFGIAAGQIDIGNAATEMTAQISTAVPQADGSLRPEPVMDVQAVADAVLYMAGLPLTANVARLTVHATTMPYVGRG
ncbi:MAG: SDR family oxidoreductase [Geodermatophilaceae bacterium]